MIERTSFHQLAREVFLLDSAIQWFALEGTGREPCYAVRDCDAEVRDAALVDPLLLMLAEGNTSLQGAGRDSKPGLQFVALVYEDYVQIVARLGEDGHFSAGIDPGVNAHAVGARLVGLLDHRRSLATIG